MSSAPTVIAALRAFLLDFLRSKPALSPPQRRALWAMQACRTPVLGGHVHACADCGQRNFAYHSCNHKACPQCGRDAKAAYDAFFAAASQALSDKLASPKWLGAKVNGFTAVLHTWNQQMQFHPHLHCIVPGGGLDARGRFVRVKSAQFLLPVPVLSRAFRHHFRQQMSKRGWQCDPAVWRVDWGVHVQPFGSGDNAVKYLGTYVARSVIADSRLSAITGTHVTFRYKDREHGTATRTLTLEGVEKHRGTEVFWTKRSVARRASSRVEAASQFVRRYLRHVLPRRLRSIRYFGFCHPAARKTRLKITALSGKPIDLGAPPPSAIDTAAKRTFTCPCCRQAMARTRKIPALWQHPALAPARAPPSIRPAA